MRRSTLWRDCFELGLLAAGGILGFVLGLLSFATLITVSMNLRPTWTIKLLDVPYVPHLAMLCLGVAGGFLGVLLVRVIRGPYPIFDDPMPNS